MSHFVFRSNIKKWFDDMEQENARVISLINTCREEKTLKRFDSLFATLIKAENPFEKESFS
jgi:hypothetical protein